MGPVVCSSIYPPALYWLSARSQLTLSKTYFPTNDFAPPTPSRVPALGTYPVTTPRPSLTTYPVTPSSLGTYPVITPRPSHMTYPVGLYLTTTDTTGARLW